MDLNAVLAKIKQHPEINRAGMIAFHYGLVRGHELDGRLTAGLEVTHDPEIAEKIKADMLARPGVVDIVYQFNDGKLKVGDPIMLVAAAGETREIVFPVLTEMVNRLKDEAVVKKVASA